MIQRYTLANLDCPMCAQRIEDDLKKLPEVKSVSINFATLSMNIDTPAIESVRDRIRVIEPAIKMRKHNEADSGDSHKKETRANLFMLVGSLVLLGVALLVDNNVLVIGPSWVTYLLFASAYILAGGQVLVRAVRNILSGRVFDEYFLMTVATIGAFAIREFGEAVAVMLFFKLGEMLQARSVRRSRGAIQELLDLQPDTARVVRGDDVVSIDLAALSIGDVMVIRPGERVPTDGTVISGSASVDTSVLTGESVPRMADPGDELLGGYLNIDGRLEVEVRTPPDASSAAKIADLVDTAIKRKARTELFITKFARIYTPIVISLALIIAVVPPLVSANITFQDALYRALTLLVISCPCALVISIPLTYFAAIGGASAHGILVKGATVFDALAKARTFVFDKTGTLTHGEFEIQKVVPYGNVVPDELLELAATVERDSNHPIARSIAKSIPNVNATAEISKYEERRGRGVIAEIDGRTILAGNDPLLHEEGIAHDTCDVPGTAVHVAENGTYAGYIIIGDRLRSGAAGIVDRLKRAGARLTVLLTGDHHDTAKRVADELRFDRSYGSLLPEDKVTRLEEIMSTESEHGNTVFLGDGINDAPVIARADVGVAMGLSGTEAAIDTADIVLMSHDPATIVEAVERAKKTRRIVLQNLCFIFGIKVLALFLGSIGVATMWQAVIADTGVTIITVLNAIRALR